MNDKLHELARETWEFIGNEIDQLDDHLSVEKATACYQRIRSALEQAHQDGWHEGRQYHGRRRSGNDN